MNRQGSSNISCPKVSSSLFHIFNRNPLDSLFQPWLDVFCSHHSHVMSFTMKNPLVKNSRFSWCWILQVTTALTPHCVRLCSQSYYRPPFYSFHLKLLENSVKQKISDRRSLFSFAPLIGRSSEKPLVSGGGGGGEAEWAECFSDVSVAERKVTSAKKRNVTF